MATKGCIECWKETSKFFPSDVIVDGDPLCNYHAKKRQPVDEVEEEEPATKDKLGFRQKKCHNPRCGKMFTPTGPRALYCSPECREDMTSHSSPSNEAAKQEVAPKNVVQDVQHSIQKPVEPKADPPKPTATESVQVPRGTTADARKLDGFEVRTFRAEEYRLPIGTKECAFPKLCANGK